MLPTLRLPGSSHRDALPALTDAQRELAERLRGWIGHLCGTLGERNQRRYEELEAAAAYLEAELGAPGLTVSRQTYVLEDREYANLEVEIAGDRRPTEIVIVGAHYDSALGSPGANDNGSGLAAILELARRFAGRQPSRTLRLVAFVNEEMPHFANGTMGSQAHARRCRARGEDVTAMLSLETIGYYDDRPGTQRYPFPVGMLYPSRGDFLGFVGNLRSRQLVADAIGAFRIHARFPSEGAVLPSSVPGVAWSDHASYWAEGYPAIMLTDTAPFRYPWYHTAQDTPDKVDYERLARVVDGIEAVVLELVDGAR